MQSHAFFHLAHCHRVNLKPDDSTSTSIIDCKPSDGSCTEAGATNATANGSPQRYQPTSLDNPDQRICEDATVFADRSIALMSLLLSKLFNMITFCVVLWQISPSLVGVLIVWAVGASWATIAIFGRQIQDVVIGGKRLDGGLRFLLVRVRENAEAVSFYGGANLEL